MQEPAWAGSVLAFARVVGKTKVDPRLLAPGPLGGCWRGRRRSCPWVAPHPLEASSSAVALRLLCRWALLHELDPLQRWRP